MPSFKTLFASAAVACLANAKTIKITATSDNTFDPDSVTADKGDVLEFYFEPKNHSVVAGDYQYPCSPMQLGTGFFSGFINSTSGDADEVFQVTITNTDPLPFYSSQGTECADGMVGIVNPTANKTLADYKKRAAALSMGVSPGKTMYGGKLVTADEASSSNSSDSSDSSDSGNSTSSSSNGDSGSSDDKKGVAGVVRVSVAGLLGAAGMVLFMM